MNQNQKNKILIIDDDAEFVKITSFRLSHQKKVRFTVSSASTLKSALELLESKKFDCILLDLTLSDSNGLSGLSNIMFHAHNTPVIVMTGLDEDKLATEAVNRGAEDFIVKGEFSPKMLVRIIQHSIGRHKIQRKLKFITKKLRHANIKLEEMVIQDPLTDLYNRRGLQQSLTREIQVSERTGTPLLALILDLDNFKKINDNLGHPCGDIVIKEIAKKIKESVRGTDYIGRIGGDEFVILLPNTTFDAGVELAERLRLFISNMNLHISQNNTIKVTASMGLTVVPESVITIDELISIADPLLTASKKCGKNQVFYEEKIDLEESNIYHFIPKHICSLRRGNNFMALKQGIHKLRDESIIGYEFLSRMQDSYFEMPDDFFKAAVENDIITLVDHHCFNTCVNAAGEISSDFSNHINLFPSTIMDTPTTKLIERLRTNQLHQYCIEISEQQILGDPSYLIEPIKKMRRSGIKVAIDDVGFGNTCLENLIFLEPNVIKVDKRCVMGLYNDPHLRKALGHILSIARNLEAEVIAEGIENKNDLNVLLDHGVELGQGYYLSIPA